MSERYDCAGVIMVVDDNEANRELLNFFLSGSGYYVIEACNGVEAITIATRERPDLIIMDLAMPVMDGFGAVRILREAPHVCHVPIVACTGHDTPTHRTEAMRVGFNEFLTKPIDFTQLHSVIERFLRAA